MTDKSNDDWNFSLESKHEEKKVSAQKINTIKTGKSVSKKLSLDYDTVKDRRSRKDYSDEVEVAPKLPSARWAKIKKHAMWINVLIGAYVLYWLLKFFNLV